MKTRKKREKTGGKWARYGLKGVKQGSSPRINWQLTDYRLPPAFSRRQLRGCHHGPGVKEQVVINEGSWVRLCSRGAVRLCIEDNASNSPGSQDTVTLYHCLDNATEGTVQYAGRPLYADRGVVFSMEFAPAIDHIITQYPRYVPVVRPLPSRHLAQALRSLLVQACPSPLAILHKLCAACWSRPARPAD